MRRHLRTLTLLSMLICLVGVVQREALAQDSSTRNELWPEVDVYINLKPKLRLFLLGTTSKSVEDGEILKADAFEAQFGAHLDYMPNKHLTLRTGYRFGTSLGDSDDEFKEHRLLTEQTLHKSLPWRMLLSDRNREDFRFVNGEFSFRYRNRVKLEKELELLRKRSIRPYIFGEGFYDTRYDVWNRTRFGGGVQIALKPGPFMKSPKNQRVLDLYYIRQHDTRSSTTHVNGFGVVLAFYF